MVGLDALAANHDDAMHGFGADALIIAESMVIAGSLNQAVKFVDARERPFVHALSPDEKLHTAHPNDNDVSFFSAHTSVGMAIAVSAGTVASMRGYRFAPIVWQLVEDSAVPEALRRLNFIFFDDLAQFEASADRLAEALQTDIGWIRRHRGLGRGPKIISASPSYATASRSSAGRVI